MEWYTGTIPAAIQLAKNNKTLFVVYISGNDEMSKQMDESWNSGSVCEASKSNGCVAVKIEANSDTCAQFSAIFPVITVPATYFIGNDGVPVEVVGGVKSVDELAKIIADVSNVHRNKIDGDSSLGKSTPDSPGASGARESTLESKEASAASASPPIDAAAAQPEISVEEKAQRARELLDQRRAEKAEQEKEKERLKEKERRETGKGMVQLKQWKEEREAKETHDQIKKEREEDRKAREKIKEQIARDREERHRRYQKEKSERDQAKEEAKIAKLKAQQEEKEKQAARKSAYACIQFRMADGSFFTQQFSSTDPLANAQHFVSQTLNKGVNTFRLCMAYPRREFTENDMSQSMADLGLSPSASIMVLPPARGTVVASSGNQGLLSMLLAPFMMVWNFIYSFLFGQASSSSTSGTQSPQQTHSNPRKRPASNSGSRREGNIHTLTRDDDDDMNTWNGNSTQQM